MIVADPIAQLCERHPMAIPVLRRHGVDPRERASLEATCLAHGLAVAAVLDELARAEAAIIDGWPARTLPALIDHIVHTYHRSFDAAVIAAAAAIDRARSAADLAARSRWAALRDALEELRTLVVEHMDKEERVLFPWLATRAGTAAGPIRAMQLEHADTIALLHAVHAAAHRCAGADTASVHAAVDEIERQLCEHIYLEDDVLFRRALES